MKRTLLLFTLIIAACSYGFDPNVPGAPTINGEQGQVVRVVDGDTIDVNLNCQTVRVRYVGMNTPERDETCNQEATAANAALVSGQTVRLVKDQSETDRFDRLLRYIYVGDTFVNARLVEQGFAEVVSYPPDNANFDYFRSLEDQARAANRGCHPTGIFNDNSYTR
jgi:micrococcal nuclease